jgi:membrane-bound ClpP family serine protease
VRHALARFLIAAGMLPAGGALPAQQAPERAKQLVLVVPVTGTIGPSTVALVRRAIREGESSGATAIVFTIDTPGGRLDSIEAIQAQLREVGEHDSTIAYVQGRALSAGAYLALACQQIYMTPSGEIGAVTPIAGMPGSVADIPDSDVRRKLISVLRAELRGLIQQRKSRLPGLELVGEAMVDPDLRVYSVVTQDANGVQQRHVVDEERIRDLEQAGQRILQREPLGGRGQPPLTLTAVEAQAIGLSNGTIS